MPRLIAIVSEMAPTEYSQSVRLFVLSQQGGRLRTLIWLFAGLFGVVTLASGQTKSTSDFEAWQLQRLQDEFKVYKDNISNIYGDNTTWGSDLRELIYKNLFKAAGSVAIEVSEEDYKLLFETFTYGSTDVAAIHKFYRKVPSDRVINLENPSELLWAINGLVREGNEALQKQSLLNHPVYHALRQHIEDIFLGDPRLARRTLFEGSPKWQLRRVFEIQDHFDIEVVKWMDKNPKARGKTVWDSMVSAEKAAIEWGEQQGYLPPAVVRKEGQTVFSIDGGRSWKIFPPDDPAN